MIHENGWDSHQINGGNSRSLRKSILYLMDSLFSRHMRIIVGNEENVHIWEDDWRGGNSFAHLYSSLYHLISFSWCSYYFYGFFLLLSGLLELQFLYKPNDREKDESVSLMSILNVVKLKREAIDKSVVHSVFKNFFLVNIFLIP